MVWTTSLEQKNVSAIDNWFLLPSSSLPPPVVAAAIIIRVQENSIWGMIPPQLSKPVVLLVTGVWEM